MRTKAKGPKKENHHPI